MYISAVISLFCDIIPLKRQLSCLYSTAAISGDFSLIEQDLIKIECNNGKYPYIRSKN